MFPLLYAISEAVITIEQLMVKQKAAMWWVLPVSFTENETK